MNCSRACKWLPLYAGADLPSKKTKRLEKHLEECPICRERVEDLRTALAGIRAVAGRETLDWPEEEWKGLMARVKSERSEPRRRSVLLPAVFQKSWAYGSALVLVLGISALILKSILAPPAAPPLAETAISTPAQPSRSFQIDQAPDARRLRDIPFRVQRSQEGVYLAALAAQPAPQQPAQNVLSLTLVSQETGLKVHWTFNKNFEWEEKKR